MSKFQITPIETIEVWLSSAGDVLRCKPKFDHIVRPRFIGNVVASFVLPLDLCKPQNTKRGAPGWLAKATRLKIAKSMFAQCSPRKNPLPGRPQVLCLRLSSSEPDKYADWCKTAIDTLCAPNKRCKERLNIIHDDAPRFADVHCWWEPAKRGEGFVYIEVRTGENKLSIEQDNTNEIQHAAKRYKDARAKLISSDAWREFLDSADQFNDTLGIDALKVDCSRVDNASFGLPVTEPDATVVAPTEPEQKYDDATVDGIVRRALSGIETVESAMTIIKISSDCGLDSKTVSKSLKRIGALNNGGVKRGVRYYLPVAATEQDEA